MWVTEYSNKVRVNMEKNDFFRNQQKFLGNPLTYEWFDPFDI